MKRVLGEKTGISTSRKDWCSLFYEVVSTVFIGHRRVGSFPGPFSPVDFMRGDTSDGISQVFVSSYQEPAGFDGGCKFIQRTVLPILPNGDGQYTPFVKADNPIYRLNFRYKRSNPTDSYLFFKNRYKAPSKNS